MLHHTKIPVGEIISRVFSSVKNHTFAILRLGLPVIIVGLISTIYYEIYEPETALYGAFTLEGLVLVVLSIAAYAMAIIGIHRVFILPPETVAHTSTFRWTSRESDWLLWSIGISFLLFLIMIIPSCLAVPSFQTDMNDPEQSITKIDGLMLLFSLLIGYFIARWSLILPSIATDGKIKSLSSSWEQSKGNAFRLFILIGVIPAITSWVISSLSTDRTMLFDIVVQILGWVVAVLEIGLLSHSYAFLAENQSNEETTSASM